MNPIWRVEDRTPKLIGITYFFFQILIIEFELLFRITQERTIQYLQEQFIQPFKDYEKNVKNTFLNDTSDALFHKIAGIIDVNCFEISNEVEISAIYEQACLMEHNCIPNTIYTFDSADNDFRITVRAATKIPKGEHISISYTNLLWGKLFIFRSAYLI